jgi:hypothetical protein
MEARNVLPKFLLLLALAGSIFATESQAQFAARRSRSPRANAGHQVSTQHFIVTASDSRLARRVAEEAERFRKELAIEWLGKELGPWQDKCPIEVEIGMHAGGETSFAFVTDGPGDPRQQRGIPVSWQMKIFGPPDRLLDAVLPHEITHTIFATHFGRPLPRWADEGACTTVEHESEKYKNHRMLMNFLKSQPSRGIPFNRMFTLKNYPDDILPLYAQGHSVAKYLIMQKGRRHFLDFVDAGMIAESRGSALRAWDHTASQFYGYKNLSDLQIAWLQWVGEGSKEIPSASVASVAAISRPSPFGGNSLNKNSTGEDERTFTSSNRSTTNNIAASRTTTPLGSSKPKELDSTSTGSWYARQSNERVAAKRHSMESENDKSNKYRSDDARLNSYQYSPTIWR